MIAPLKTKLVGVEVSEPGDSRVERFGPALRRRQDRMILSDVARLSSR